MVATDGTAPMCVCHLLATLLPAPTPNLALGTAVCSPQIHEGSGKDLPVPHPDHMQDGWAADAVKSLSGTSGAIWVMAGDQ